MRARRKRIIRDTMTIGTVHLAPLAGRGRIAQRSGEGDSLRVELPKEPLTPQERGEGAIVIADARKAPVEQREEHAAPHPGHGRYDHFDDSLIQSFWARSLSAFQPVAATSQFTMVRWAWAC